MNINIYEDYAIKYNVNSGSLSEEHEHIEVINGVDLLELIVSKITDDYFNEFTIVGKELHFEIFNYNNGENESICIEILGSGKHESK